MPVKLPKIKLLYETLIIVFCIILYQTNACATQVADVSKTLVDSTPAQISYYREPSIILDNKQHTIQVTSNTPPAGIYFSYLLNPQKRYRVNLIGKNLAGKAVLNIEEDGKHEWLNAPEGQLTWVIHAVKQFKVLIYSDNKFSYQSNEINIQPCKGCLTKQEIIDKYTSIAKRMVKSKFLKSVSFYNLPVIAADTDGELIDIQQAPAGIQYDFLIEPRKKYLLTIRGNVISGKPIIKVKQDAQSRWLNIDKNSLQTKLDATQQLEVLIYADTKAQYKLQQISLEECPSCKTDKDLKAEILRDNPLLTKQLKIDRLAAANTILKWSANHTVVPIIIKDSSRVQDVGGLSASEIYYDVFKSGQKGVYCGGAAVFLTKLYHLLGITAFTIDTGVAGTLLTHVTTVVVDNNGDTKSYYIFDPTFNLTFINEDTGKFANLFEILHALKNGQFQKRIKVVHGNLDTRAYIADYAIKAPEILNYLIDQKHVNGLILFHTKGDFLCQRYVDKFGALLQKSNFVLNDSLVAQFILRSVIAVGDAPSIEEQAAFLKFMQQFYASVK